MGEKFREDDSDPEEDFTRALLNNQTTDLLSNTSPSKSTFTVKISPLQYIEDMERRSYFFTRLKELLDNKKGEANPMLLKYLEQGETNLHKGANQITNRVIRLAGLQLEKTDIYYLIKNYQNYRTLTVLNLNQNKL